MAYDVFFATSRGEGPILKNADFTMPPLLARRQYAGTFRQPIAWTYRCQARNSHVVSHVARPAPLGRSLVALSPNGLTLALGRRGGSTSAGT